MIVPEMPALTAALRDSGMHITIETAGTVDAPVVCDLMSISPKLSNSTPRDSGNELLIERHEQLRLQPDVLMRLMRFQVQLKFVVCDQTDMAEIENIVDLIGVRNSEVVLMAEGTSPGILAERGRWLVEICKEKGFRFSPRLHVDLWGQKRGV